MPASSASKKVVPLSAIKGKVNTSLVIDSRSLYNKLANQTDIWISKNWHNVDVQNLQSFSSLRLFKLFAANDSSYSAALTTHIRMMVDNFRITAYKENDSSFKEGQDYIDELKHRFSYEDKWADGFTISNTINDQVNQIARNILTSDNASAAMFIKVFSDTFEVDQFKILDCDRINFTNESTENIFKSGSPFISGEFGLWMRGKSIPYIYEEGKRVLLNVANFLWQQLDPDAEQITGNNPLRPALRNTFTKLEFLDNLRKVLRNQAWPKVKVILDEEAVINSAPPDVRADKKQLIEYFNDYLAAVEAQLTNISVDQNIIVYDTIKEISFLESNSKFDPQPIASLLDSEAISSLKAPPSTVGKGGSTRTGEGLASAELVIFRRTVKALRNLVETLYSRAFTFALRMKGLKGYVKFRFNEFSLRPPEESAQFDQIRTEMLERHWILGAIGDDELHRKLRQMDNLEGKPPADAKLREDLMEAAGKTKQTERLPDAERQKEEKRSETRKQQKTGNEKKAYSVFKIDENTGLFQQLNSDFIPAYFIKKNRIDWEKLYQKGNIHWADDLQSSKFAQRFANKMVDENKQTVLEIGCGNGKDSILFAQADRIVTAIDRVPKAIEIAKENAKLSNVKINFLVGDSENLKFKDNSFSAVFTLSVLHSTNFKKSLSEIARVIKKEGIFFIYIYSDVTKINGEKKTFITIDEFITEVKKTDFDIIDLYTLIEDEYDEAGEKHSIVISELKKN